MLSTKPSELFWRYFSLGNPQPKAQHIFIAHCQRGKAMKLMIEIIFK